MRGDGHWKFVLQNHADRRLHVPWSWISICHSTSSCVEYEGRWDCWIRARDWLGAGAVQKVRILWVWLGWWDEVCLVASRSVLVLRALPAAR
jgi:hypothetical protein